MLFPVRLLDPRVVLGTVEASGTWFAVPTQRVRLAEDEDRVTNRDSEAEEIVSRWRAEDRLPFPDHAEDEIASFTNTLDYPPKGSRTT